MPPTSRPQTLKQAKRAYRKSGATIRLSASEIAQAERRAALQERADRIKEREARRKANLKKREEKIARERETARRMGRNFADDKKPGWKVGTSQLSLGGFLGGVQKLHPDQEVPKNLQPEENRENVEITAQQEQDEVDKFVTCMSPPGPQSAKSIVQDHVCFPPKERSPNSFAIRMSPPPKRLPRSVALADDTFDDCFPSNTQIERELSLPLTKPSPIPSAAKLQSPPLSPVQIAASYNAQDADDLLACISTQDLDFSGALTQAPRQAAKQQDAEILAQICSQDLDFENESSRPTSKPEPIESDSLLAQICTQDLDFSDDIQPETRSFRKDSDDGLMDCDIEDLAMELEVDSAAAKKTPQEDDDMGESVKSNADSN